jgi:pyrimidine operon attenuation protein/uracil phosphoribosyltransferase
MSLIADAKQIDHLVEQLAAQIRGFVPPGALRAPEPMAFIGIRRRGDVLAERLARKLGVSDVGSIDITLYRDDLSETAPVAKVGRTNIPFSVEGRDLVLVDDVVMTGRSVLAALREILDYGRPARIRLAVLVARPERELPIEPAHAALRLAPGAGEKVDVRLTPQDETDSITINARS